MRCSKCGRRVKKNFKLCPDCGEKIIIQESSKKVNLKMIFILISIIIISLSLVFIIFGLNNNFDLEKLKESVVQIYVYNEENEQIASGSGVVAFDDKIVLTNAHVIEENYRLEIITENNVKYSVDGILAYDKSKDLAILKVKEGKKLKKVKTKNKIKIGDSVTAIGSPLGLKNTVSNGNISGYFQDNIEVYQHTAPISHGSSGGALFDKSGNLIGITYASIEGGQNINLAIPIEYYDKLYEKRKNNYSIDTNKYKYLSNKIIQTKNGSELLNYVLNDEYGNNRWKSGIIEEVSENNDGGTLESCKDLSNCIYINKMNYNQIKNYADSSLYIFSGKFGDEGYVYDADKGEFYFDESSVEEGQGYKVIIIKKNEMSNDNKIRDFFKKEIEDINENDIVIKKGYAYYFNCTNYDKCSSVKKILDKFN